MSKVVSVLLLSTLAVGCSAEPEARGELREINPPKVAGYGADACWSLDGYTDMCRITIPDSGQQCVVLHGQDIGGISCDWSRP